ncbi:MAG: AAA domain-containing protein [Syntrophales bacterium]
MKNHDISVVIEKASVAIEHIKRERVILSETIYLDMVPSDNELIQAILAMREGDAWYRIFQKNWRKACRIHRILDKSKAPKSGSQRLQELERLLDFQKAKASWHADQTYKDALGPLYQGEDTPFDKATTLVLWLTSTQRALVEAGLEETAFNALEISEINIIAMADCHSHLNSATASLAEGKKYLEHHFSQSQTLAEKLRESSTWPLLKELLNDLGALTQKAADDLLIWSPGSVLASDSIRAVKAYILLPRAIEEVDMDMRAKGLLGKEFCSTETNTEPAWFALSYGRSVLKSEISPAIRRLLLSEMVDANFKNILDSIKAIKAGWGIVDGFANNMSEYGLFDVKQWTGVDLDDTQFLSTFVIRAVYAVKSMDRLLPWVQYLQQTVRASERGLGEFVSLLESGKVAPEFLSNTFGYCFYSSITSRQFRSCPALGQFAGATHDTIRAEFASLDRDIIKLRGQECAHNAAQKCVPPQGKSGARVDDKTELSLLNYLFPQIRPRISIRKMMKQAGRAIQAFKPCFMMGPQAVAQFLEPGTVKFDIVVMDEASQLKPEEAIGAIARGTQLIVVGDPKQLPPTTFFDRLSLTSDDGEDEGQQAAALFSKSILDVCMGHFQPVRTLRWHYRSRHESLIAFSNHNFYRGNLIIFPSPYPKGKSLGVHYHYIANAIYQDQMNVVEAKQVSDAVIDHMLNHPDDSLGVVTLNIKQRDLIEELLDQRYRNVQNTEEYRIRWEREGMGFFVKNLENVQGDERDIIFISATFGKPPGATVVRQNFGPISRADGWRRLNVLFTRARKAVRVFSSMQPEDIIVDANTPLGTKTLHDYLEYARSGILIDITPTGGEAESDFELSVADVLRNHNFEVEPQLGVAGFRIDIAVKHPNYVSGYLAAIECDGATYHSGVSVRDRDRIRQEILESLGWKNRIWRIWSTDWFRNPGRETSKLIAFLNEIKNTPLDGAYFVKPEEIVVQTVRPATKTTQLTLQGLGVSVIETEDDELEVEVGDTVFYVIAEHPENEIKVRITSHQHNPTAGLIPQGHPLAQAMLGALVNDNVMLKDEHGRRKYVIKKIVKERSAESPS